MVGDPLTLTIALDQNGSASGKVYLDDGHSFDYTDGAFIHRQFTFESSRRGWVLSSAEVEQGASYADGDEIMIERVQVLGLKQAPKEVVTNGHKLEFSWADGKAASVGKEGRASLLTIKKPLLRVGDDFKIAG